MGLNNVIFVLLKQRRQPLQKETTYAYNNIKERQGNNMPKKQTTKKRSKKSNSGIKLFLLVIVVALLTFGVLSLMRYLSDEKRQIDDQKDKNTASFYEEDTKSDSENKPNGYDAKDEAEKEADSNGDNQTNSDGKTVANVIISSVGALDDKVIASGMVSNVIEEGGSCIYAFTNGEETITETASGIANAKNTVCGSVLLEKSRFKIGTWEASLHYQSVKTEGQSEVQTFEVK